jgi:von Willebrand factor type A domain
MSNLRTIVAPLLGALLLAACGSDSGSNGEFDPAKPPVIELGGGDGGNTTLSLGDGGTGNAEFAKCAEGNAKSDLLPLTLFFIIDRSGSMCETPKGKDCNDATSKWQQALTGLRSFFKSPDSRNISASFVTFAGSGNGGSCNPSSFQKADAPLTALPDTADVLGTKLASIARGNGTPTEDALTGGIAYAKTIRPKSPAGGSFAVVFVTDGLPEGCSDQGDITKGAAVCAKAQADGVPVYIVGVGNALSNLNALALAAKTNNNKAFLISTANPATVSTELNAAFQTIRGATAGCKIKLPAPPDGQTLDPKKVNLELTKGDGTKVPIRYSASCSDASGWKYDNEAAPTQLELCATACSALKGDNKSSIGVVFGCSTVNTTN